MAEIKSNAAVPIAAQDNSPITVAQMNAALSAAEARILSHVTEQIRMESTDPGGSGGGIGAGAGDLATALPNTPFATWYDYEKEGYVMSVPSGCVTVDGIDLTPQEDEEKVLKGEGTYYLHIKYPSQGESNPDPAVIDTDSDTGEYDLTFAIVEIGETGIDMQYLTGALHLSRGGGAQLCFQPVFGEDGEVEETLNPYIMVGRRIIEATGSVDGDGSWGVKVSHGVKGKVTAEIVSDVEPEQDNTDSSETMVPLYEISDGEIVNDYRGMPVVPLYDVEV